MHKLKISLLVLSLGLVLTNYGRAELLISWDLPVSSTATSVVASQVATGIQAGSLLSMEGMTPSSSSFLGWGGTGLPTSTYPSSSRYFAFSITAETGYDVSITGAESFSIYRSTNGPQRWDLLYSSSWEFSDSALYATFELSYDGFAQTKDITIPLSLALSANPVNITSGNTSYFRLAPYAAGFSAGVARIQAGTSSDVSFTGSITPVPEPSSLSLLLIGVAGLASRRLLKQRG